MLVAEAGRFLARTGSAARPGLTRSWRTWPPARLWQSGRC